MAKKPNAIPTMTATFFVNGEKQKVSIVGHNKDRGLVRVLPHDLSVSYKEVWTYLTLKSFNSWANREERELFLNRFSDYCQEHIWEEEEQDVC